MSQETEIALEKRLKKFSTEDLRRHYDSSMSHMFWIHEFSDSCAISSELTDTNGRFLFIQDNDLLIRRFYIRIIVLVSEGYVELAHQYIQSLVIQEISIEEAYKIFVQLTQCPVTKISQRMMNESDI